jgi:flagellar basal body-associated protein FliL
MSQVMDFLYKLENFLNALILKLGSKLLSFVPVKIRVFFETFSVRWGLFINFLKKLPALIKDKLPGLKSWALNYKLTVVEPLKEALTKYNSGRKEKAGQLKVVFLAPFLIIGQWLKGLSPLQSLVLLCLTGASILSTISIISSSSRLIHGHESGRSPASAEEEAIYERPAYYKKDTKHLTITNLRLPVYISQVNELRSVDIDFTATMTTRESKQFLEKKEFQLRDHLILEIEPSVASFPLTEEGKEIIKHKIRTELDQFLKDHKIPGYCEDMKVVYILAN